MAVSSSGKHELGKDDEHDGDRRLLRVLVTLVVVAAFAAVFFADETAGAVAALVIAITSMFVVAFGRRDDE